jgi:hypothetical protein
MFAFPQPHYMPCAECGASVGRADAELHVCDPQRRAEYRFFQCRAELEQFDAQLVAFLASPRGRFEVWYAAQRRRRG